MPRSPRKAARTAFPLLAIAFAVWCATAWASPTITVELPDATPKQVDLATLDAEPGTTYRMRSKKGEDYEPKTVPEYYSLSSVLRSVGALNGFKELTVDPEGAITISKDQLNDVPPPALYLDGDGRVRFIRNSASSNDINSTSYTRTFEVTRLVQSSASSLKVDASASSGAKTGEAVKFEVVRSGGGAGKDYRFEWDFGDGATAEGKAPTHKYDEAGLYRVTVKAMTTDSDGEDGEEIVERVGRLRVKIGEPEDTSGDPGAGGTNDAAGAPDSGAYGGSSGAGSAYGGSSSTPYTPSTPTTDPFDNITTDQDPAPSTFGDTVEGTLLASASTTVPDAASESAARAAQSGDPDFDVPESDDAVPPAAWAGVGALFLVGAGAGLESGRRPHLRRPRLRLPVPRR